jgi:hypothetical protein
MRPEGKRIGAVPDIVERGRKFLHGLDSSHTFERSASRTAGVRTGPLRVSGLDAGESCGNAQRRMFPPVHMLNIVAQVWTVCEEVQLVGPVERVS